MIVAKSRPVVSLCLQWHVVEVRKLWIFFLWIQVKFLEGKILSGNGYHCSECFFLGWDYLNLVPLCFHFPPHIFYSFFVDPDWLWSIVNINGLALLPSSHIRSLVVVFGNFLHLLLSRRFSSSLSSALVVISLKRGLFRYHPVLLRVAHLLHRHRNLLLVLLRTTVDGNNAEILRLSLHENYLYGNKSVYNPSFAYRTKLNLLLQFYHRYLLLSGRSWAKKGKGSPFDSFLIYKKISRYIDKYKDSLRNDSILFKRNASGKSWITI